MALVFHLYVCATGLCLCVRDKRNLDMHICLFSKKHCDTMNHVMWLIISEDVPQYREHRLQSESIHLSIHLKFS